MPTGKSITKQLPNVITLLNLVSGCLSIVAALDCDLQLAGLFIILAAVFDFLDGFTARLIGAYTMLGKELDSLSDVVSFGVAPSMIIYELMRQSLELPKNEGLLNGHWLLLIPFVMAAFSSLRLGMFNLDERQSSSFIGLPTPANALMIVGLTFGLNSTWADVYGIFTSSVWALTAIVALQSFLLVCELPMFSFKIKSLKLSVAYKQLLFLSGAAVLVVIFLKAALSLIIVWYVFLSLVFYLTGKMWKKQHV